MVSRWTVLPIAVGPRVWGVRGDVDKLQPGAAVEVVDRYGVAETVWVVEVVLVQKEVGAAYARVSKTPPVIVSGVWERMNADGVWAVRLPCPVLLGDTVHVKGRRVLHTTVSRILSQREDGSVLVTVAWQPLDIQREAWRISQQEVGSHVC